MNRLIGLTATIFALIWSMSAFAQADYPVKMTSGPFVVIADADSVDWMITSNDSEPVDVKVTIYQLNIGSAKTTCCVSGLELTLFPGETTHNANGVGTVFTAGAHYEVVIESTSELVHPIVVQWSNASSYYAIPETLIPAGDFLIISKPEKVKGPK